MTLANSPESPRAPPEALACYPCTTHKDSPTIQRNRRAADVRCRNRGSKEGREPSRTTPDERLSPGAANRAAPWPTPSLWGFPWTPRRPRLSAGGGVRLVPGPAKQSSPPATSPSQTIQPPGNLTQPNNPAPFGPIPPKAPVPQLPAPMLLAGAESLCREV